MYIFWESTQKARREHFCDHCCNWIMPGDEYSRYAWVPQPGRFFILKKHMWPECPPDEYAHANSEEIEVAVSFRYALTYKAVTLMRVDGTTETKMQPEFVLVSEAEIDQPTE